MSQFYFRDHETYVPYGICGICGCDTLVTRPQHSGPVHEVFALEKWGKHAVIYPARDHVEGWASGETPLPTEEEFRANNEAWHEAHADIPFTELVKQQAEHLKH